MMEESNFTEKGVGRISGFGGGEVKGAEGGDMMMR